MAAGRAAVGNGLVAADRTAAGAVADRTAGDSRKATVAWRENEHVVGFRIASKKTTRRR